MATALPDKLNVLIITPLGEAGVERIRAVAPERLNVVRALFDFVPELKEEWPPPLIERFIPAGESPRTPAETEALLRDAHVVLVGVPFPKTLPRRAKNLIWAHFGFAGVSNIQGSDWWGTTSFQTTSSRGYTQALPIAEMVLAATFMFAKRLDFHVQNTAAGVRRAPLPEMKVVRGKTMGIIGLGGIGRHVARLAKACGMRVVANRRSVASRQENVEGVDVLYPAADLHALLAQSDFVAVCAMWTAETEHMLNREAFAATKPGAFVLNVARGEIIDEPALVEALVSGRLGGAYLDVWRDDQGSQPIPELLVAPNVVFSPHVSGVVDESHAFSLDVFCDNLRRLLNGEPLENAVDWSRGY